MPGPILLAIPLLLFALLAVTFLLVLRRAARVVAQTRELDGFRQSAGDLATRIAQQVGLRLVDLDRLAAAVDDAAAAQGRREARRVRR